MSSSLKKKVLVALTGTAIAQVIHLLFTPILSRVYSPSDFGELSLFISILGVCSAFASARYDMAIVIANKGEQKSLLYSIKKISLIICLALLVIGLAFSISLNRPYIIFSILLAIAVFSRANYNSFRAFINSNGNYKELGKGKVFENFSNGLMALGLFAISFKDQALLIAKSLSLVIGALYYKYIASSDIEEIKDTVNEKETLNKYSDFPKFTILSELLIQLNLGFSIFAFTALYSSVSAGFIGLTTRVLSLPINFIGLSFLDVFRERATKDFQETGDCSKIFIKFAACLLATALPILGTILLWGDDLFVMAFGKEWLMAGQYAKILVFLYSIRLLTSPLGFTFFLNNAQKTNLIFQFLVFILSLTAIGLAYKLELNELDCLRLYTASLTALYFIYLLFAYKHCKAKSS